MTSTTSTPVMAGDAQAIRDVVGGVYAAWADHDADAFAALYLLDASVVQPGIHKKNQEDVRSTMAAAFAGPLKGSTVLDVPQEVRFLGSEAAVMITEGGVLMAGESELPASRRVRATWVFAKQDGQWLVAAYHNSPAG